MMKLYHGSNVSVEVPDLKFSKPDKDFGTERALNTLKRI